MTGSKPKTSCKPLSTIKNIDNTFSTYFIYNDIFITSPGNVYIQQWGTQFQHKEQIKITQTYKWSYVISEGGVLHVY
jgi:hypothetical protein